MRVTAKELRECIRTLRQILVGRSLLADNANRLLEEVHASLEQYVPRGRVRARACFPWQYTVAPEAALAFRECECNGRRYQVDIYCRLEGEGRESGQALKRQSVVVRVWSADVDLCAREQWDSNRVLDLFTSGVAPARRVLLREHFDLADPAQEGPRFHMQVGGGAKDDEYCWHPRELALPRVLHLPIDVVLACELVIANFFPDDYRELREDPEWRPLVCRSEEFFVRPFVAEWLESFQRGDGGRRTLLHAAWNV